MVSEKLGLKLLGIKNTYTQYDVLHHFLNSLLEALRRLNVQVSLIDLAFYQKSLLSVLYKNPIDLTLAFNGPRALQGNTFLSDILQIPHVAWLIDSAHYFDNFHESSYNILICPDLASCKVIKEKGCKNAFFLPHGFEASYATAPETVRPYPITFLGTLLDPIAIEEKWNEMLTQTIKKDLQEAAFKVLYEINLTQQEAFRGSAKTSRLF